MPRIPVGTGGNPQPQTPPSHEAEPAAPLGTGAFTYFRNQAVQPTGASRSTDSVVEPCAVHVRDTALQVGNWYAALSRDSGQSWINIFPQSFFPPLDAGFCCDQRIDYVYSHDITVWALQYGYSATTRNGSMQIAVANGRDELRSGNASDWTLYQFDPTDFGFPRGHWLDFPDVGFNDDWFYMSANVYDGTTGSFTGAVVWRMSLYDLQQNTAATFSWLTDATMGGNSYRFATRAGDGTGMYWASLLSTTTIRIWYQNRIGINRSFVDRTTAAWQWTITNDCPGPDGRGWLGDATRNPIGRIRGACGNATELIFAWTSDGNGGNRPLPYTRVARYRVSDRTLIAEHDVYSTTDCWAYAALDSNNLGHIGGVIAVGGASRYVRTSSFLIDGYENGWNGVIAYRMGEPTNNPPREYFGDYFDVQRSWTNQRTFIGTGTFMNGGDQTAHVEPHYTWFGRNDYEPTYVALNVSSRPIQGIPITIDVTDNDNLRDGSTNFRRTFVPYQGYQLNAPYLYSSNGTVYVFQRWMVDGNPWVLGQNILTIANMGITDDNIEAVYEARRTITFDTSSHITTPVGLTISPQDLSGQSNGATVFSRQYLEGTQVTMTMPGLSVGGHPFKQWRINNTAYPIGQQTVTFTLGSRDATATAVFYVHTLGTFAPFGAGCDGSNGPDVHTGVGRPEIGLSITYGLTGGPPASVGAFILGASNTSWLGVPLPLAVPNAAPCLLHASMDVSLPTVTGTGGVSAFPVTIPNNISLIGGRLYTQFVSVDLGANNLGVTLSNGVDTLVGGSR